MQQPVIIFDGVCNLCNSSVQFVIRHDKKKQFLFASLQSDYGQKVLKEHELPYTTFNSFLLLQNSKLYTKSSGALQVARQLDGGWPLLYGFIVIPKFIRDAVYSFIARNRYRWFGKQDTCWLPTPDLKARFLG
ncbi:thiol-disulfide oxidoreductase DCC family protein [Foetidibacter luteolus]|uniref:thiol-disulfide oxidoreductase DCC family protein n=1 Tax=Foetidibacter luteolus TaxID=2608880 RepID=UPI00129AA423|nr:thiol-disulfide oxidoreductase DCC family protein [Foetidibacter luteolus]